MKPHLETASSGIIDGHVYEFGHAKDDPLHIHLRLWKAKPNDSEEWGNAHLRGEPLCDLRITHDLADGLALSFHSALAALEHVITRESNKKMRALKTGAPE